MALFEGNEKVLDIQLKSPVPGLRKDQLAWKAVVNACGARIVSRISTRSLDAYILSESSLFVWDNYIHLITCGKTDLLMTLDPLFSLVDKGQVNFFLYGRKNLRFPLAQASDFEAEAARAYAYFPGKSYRLGPANHDHLHLFFWSRSPEPPEQGATLRVLMSDIDPLVAALFRRDKAMTCAKAEERSGLSSLFPDQALLDCRLFDPVGYSANGVLGEEYFTVHITPQAEGSYASFETSIADTRLYSRIRRAVRVFRPRRFSVALVTTLDLESMALHKHMEENFSGYTVAETSLYRFAPGYSVSFFTFCRTLARSGGLGTRLRAEAAPRG